VKTQGKNVSHGRVRNTDWGSRMGANRQGGNMQEKWEIKIPKLGKRDD